MLSVRERLPGLRHGTEALGLPLARALRPAEELSVSDWADRYRIVAAESGSPHPGPWRTSRVPYLRQIMDCLHPDHPARRIAVRASAQVGKSEVSVNWFGFIADRAPGSTLIVLPSGNEATKFNRTKLQPTIDASPRIRARVQKENSRDEAASTAAFKRFVGGFAQLVTASSSKGLQAISIKNLIFEEVSEYPWDVAGRGDPMDQGRARQLAYGDLTKEYASATPALVGKCRITSMVEAGDRRMFYLRCPHCGAYVTLAHERLGFDAKIGRAVFSCAGCGADIPDDPDIRQAMLATGDWVPTFVGEGEEPVPEVIAPERLADYACPPCEGRCRDLQPSYMLWAAYSPMQSWTDIWFRKLDAEANPVKLKAYFQQTRGEPFDPGGDAPDWEKLLERRETFAARCVPAGAPVLTGAADVNGTWIDWYVWAWGPGGQGWMIDRGQIPGDPATPEPWRILAEVHARQYPTPFGAPVGIDLLGVDVNYLTPHAYAFVNGRPRTLALIGKGGERLPLLGSARRSELKDEAGRVVTTMLYHQVGTYAGKSLVMQGLRALLDGPSDSGLWPPGTLHLTVEIADEEVVRQLTAESLVPRETPNAKRTGHLVFEWAKAYGRRNEALDCTVYARALAWHLGIDTIAPERWAELMLERGCAEPHAKAERSPPSRRGGRRDSYLGGRGKGFLRSER